MTTLYDISQSDPATSETPTLGASRIRALEAALLFTFAVEHALTGEHKIPRGPLANSPAAGFSGRFFILEVVGLDPKLQYDNGSSWIDMFDPALYSLVSDLSAHIAANPIDHPSASITAVKIFAGAILKKHLDGSNDATNISSLVDAGNADTLHTHDLSGTIGDASFYPNVLSDLRDGHVILGRSNGASAHVTLNSYIKLKEIKMLLAGTVTVYHTSVAQIAGGAAISVSYSDTGITFVKNDLLQVYGRLQPPYGSGALHFYTRPYKNGIPIGAEHDNAPGGYLSYGYVSDMQILSEWFTQRTL